MAHFISVKDYQRTPSTLNLLELEDNGSGSEAK
jgi:hypothetical protein